MNEIGFGLFRTTDFTISTHIALLSFNKVDYTIEKLFFFFFQGKEDLY